MLVRLVSISSRMKIRLIGQRNSLGIGTHYAKFADALRRRSFAGALVEEIEFTDSAAIEQAIATTSDTDINISFVGVNIHEFFKGVNIQWVVFETTEIPKNILENMLGSDQIWIPSTWGRQVLLDHKVPAEKIHVVPEGIDPDQFYPPVAVRPPNQPMRFLFVGKYEQRKSLNEIFDAWSRAFGTDTTVELIIKTNYFTHDPDRMANMQQRVKELGLPNLTVIWGEYTPDEMLALYRSADVFVFPSKAEAWGLPLIEAAAMGLPLITTCYSAPCDFLGEIKSSCLFVDYDIGPVTCPDHQKYYPSDTGTWGNWAIPRVDSLSDCFRAAKAQYNILAVESIKNSEIVRKNWSWTKSVDRALAAIGFKASF
jgi:glycosyltransferase involved in cell wall biosynthesis